MKKSICLIFVFTMAVLAYSLNAKEVAVQAAEKDSVEQSVNYLKKTIPLLTSPADTRSANAFLAAILEQSGDYSQAITYYAKAASIAAKDAEGMPKKSSEQLVIDAVRCALSCGDWSSAQNYLNSAVRSSENSEIAGYVKLYEQWSILCKAQTTQDTTEALAMLKTYSTLESLKTVRPQILLTLWHITGESGYSQKLKKDFPKSLECAIVKGEVQTLPAPFWYFVPRSSNSSPEVESVPAVEEKTEVVQNSTSAKENSTEKQKEKAEKIVRQQLGLFREKANADGLIQKLMEKGFSAFITDEIRPSGTKYYLVVVNENAEGTMGTELRNAGFECYPVFE